MDYTNDDGYRVPLAEERYNAIEAMREAAALESMECETRQVSVERIIKAQLRASASVVKLSKKTRKAIQEQHKAERRLARQMKKARLDDYGWASLGS